MDAVLTFLKLLMSFWSSQKRPPSIGLPCKVIAYVCFHCILFTQFNYTDKTANQNNKIKNQKKKQIYKSDICIIIRTVYTEHEDSL